MVRCAIFAVLLSGLLITPETAYAKGDWPQWRGPDMSGVAAGANPPTEWSETKNIRWKVPVAGKGLASPIVWKDTIYLLTAVPTGDPISPPEPKLEASPQDQANQGQQRQHRGPRGIKPDYKLQYKVIAFERMTGKIAWQRIAAESLPHEGIHNDASWASISAITDGTNLYALFGSPGLYCYNLDGKLLWQADLGSMRIRNSFGEGSSPTLYGDYLIVNWDHEDQSYIVAFDKHSGKIKWKKDRDEPTSWSTPIVRVVDGKPQVIVNATNAIRGYDLASGDVVWSCAGMTVNTIPSPVEADGVVYLASGFRGNALLAIRLAGAKGDITGSDHVLWQYERDTPYVPSMLLYRDTLYFLKRNNGILTVFDVKSGKPLYGPHRLQGIDGVYSSPVAASDRIYLPGRNGTTLVLAHGGEPKILATNVLDDSFNASPAIAGDELYLRGNNYLYCIAAK